MCFRILQQGSWGSGKDQCSTELLRSSIFASRKRKKTKDKPQLSSSDDDLDVFSKKELQEESDPNWPPNDQTEEAESEAGVSDRLEGSKEVEHGKGLSSVLVSNNQQLPSVLLPLQTEKSFKKPSQSPTLKYRAQVARQNSLSDPPSNYDEGCVSDLGTLNSTSSQASGPRVRQGRNTSNWAENSGAAEVCSITSDYSTTSSMTFLTGVESNALSPEVRSVAESRGDDADDERSELISEGRHMETDSESDLSVFASGRDCIPAEESSLAEDRATPMQDTLSLIPSHRIIACDTLSRKRGSRQKTDSESSTDGGRSEKESGRLSRMLEPVKIKSGGSPNLSRSESEREKSEFVWRPKITDRLKCRLRSSADDMFGVGSQRTRSPETRSKKKTNIRRRHTMGGQRDFAELSVIGCWQGSEVAELSAMDRLKPKCTSQDFSITDWIVRERHRASNPEVSLDTLDLQAARTLDSFSTGASRSSSSMQMLNGEAMASHSKGLDAHPHKLSGTQVVRSRFYQYL